MKICKDKLYIAFYLLLLNNVLSMYTELKSFKYGNLLVFFLQYDCNDIQGF